MESITQAKILAVEGSDEVNFFMALLEYQGISGVQIFNFEGKTNFPLRIRSIVNIPGFRDVTVFGIVRDADQKPPQSALDSITGALQKAELPSPQKINDFSDGKPSVGVFVIPDKQYGPRHRIRRFVRSKLNGYGRQFLP